MPAVVGELEPGDELGVAEHGGHALAGVVVEDGQGLVRAGGRRVDPAAVERDLDQRPVLDRGQTRRNGALPMTLSHFVSSEPLSPAITASSRDAFSARRRFSSCSPTATSKLRAS